MPVRFVADELAQLREEAEQIYALTDVPWNIFAKVIHKADVVYREGALFYGADSGRSFYARQDDQRFQVVSGLLPLDKANNRKLYQLREQLLGKLAKVNQKAERQSVEDHFDTYVVKVTPYEPWNPCIEPRCFYPHTFLEYGILKTHAYWDSTAVKAAAAKLLERSPNGGELKYDDIDFDL